MTLMSALYKVYMMVLTERLKTELEGKRIIPQNQAGFREEIGTIDNIYVLNYLVNRQIRRKRRKMVAVFIDLKAAFDTVDRSILREMMRRKGIRKDLIGMVEETLRETRCRVKMQGEMGGRFWMARGVRQGCPLNPLLFNILMADLEEQMGQIKWGVRLKGGRKCIHWRTRMM